jgi:4-aminobutyrate aminotransferase
MGSLALTGSKSVQKRGFFPVMPGAHHVPYAYCYRCAYGKQPETCAVECVQHIEKELFRTTVPADDVAAIFVEAVQGEGGYVVPPKKFFDELRKLADKHGILLVFDEVQSGMGRTGKMFASEHFDAKPDIITLAKGIASGLPLGAMVARAELMDWKPGAHASTFGGNPVAIEASLATIELLEQELIDNAARIGKHILSRLRDLPKRCRIVGDVRGLGLMIGIELVHDQATKERAPDLRDRLVQMCFERGLLVLGAGPNSLRLCPPLVITRDQADFAVDTVESRLDMARTQGAEVVLTGYGRMRLVADATVSVGDLGGRGTPKSAGGPGCRRAWRGGTRRGSSPADRALRFQARTRKVAGVAGRTGRNVF